MTLNADIKTKARKSGVFLWEIATKIGIADTTMSRKLRRELPNEEKQKIFAVIDEIAKEKAAR